MSALQPGGGDVFRGLPLAGAPVRLQRRAAPPSAESAVVPQADAAALLAEQQARALQDAVREGRAEGVRLGFEQGLREGLAAAQARNDAALHAAVQDAVAAAGEARETLVALLGALQTSRRQWLADAEDDMVALCFGAVCRLLGENAIDPELVRRQLAHLLAEYGAGPVVELRVHPQDLALAESLPALAAPCTWVADADVALGGCIVRGAAGGLDLRLEVMLARLKDALLQARLARAAAPAQGAKP
jgi:flagellar assembly protein FliH